MKVRSPRNWSPSSRSSWRAKSEDAPGAGVRGPGGESGRERAGLAGAFAAARTGVDAEDLARVDFGKDRVPGEELGFGVVDAAGGRRRHQAAVGGEQVDVEFVERDLGQVFEVGLHLAGHRDPGGTIRRALRASRTRRRRGTGGTGCRASVRRCRSSRSRVPSRATEWIANRADLRVVGTAGRPFGAEVRLGIGAGALTIGGVRIDRQPFGQGDDRRPELGRRRGAVKRLRIGEGDVEARGRVGLLGRRRGEEGRLEGLRFAFGDRRIGRVRERWVVRVLVGLDFEADRKRLPGADRRVVGQRVDRDRRGGRFGNAARPFFGQAAGRVAGGPLGESLRVVTGFRREPPEDHPRFGQRRQLGDVRDGEPEAVVASRSAPSPGS